MANRIPTTPADRTEWIELLGTAPTDTVLSAVGLSRPIWKSIVADRCPAVPVASLSLARFRRYCLLSDLLGAEWEGFEIRSNRLLFPGLKYPIPAQELRSTWFQVQELRIMRSNIEILTNDLARADAEKCAAEESAHYWRRQCSLESRAGLMLANLL